MIEFLITIFAALFLVVFILAAAILYYWLVVRYAPQELPDDNDESQKV